MELSDKRLAANRANAKRSTGPKSVHGRKISARNGIRHGILANAVLIEGESRESFLDLLADFTAEYQPATLSEENLVERAATAQWRQLRTITLESAAIIHEMRHQADSHAAEDTPTRVMLAMRSLSDNSRNPELMRRYEHSFDMQYYRAMKALNAVRDQKQAQNADSAARTHLTSAE